MSDSQIDGGLDVVCAIYVYRLRNGGTQLMCADTDDWEYAREILEAAITCLEPGSQEIKRN